MLKELQAQSHTCVQRCLQRRAAQTRKHGQPPGAAQESGHRLCALLRTCHGYAVGFTSLALPLLWVCMASDGPGLGTLGNVQGFLVSLGCIERDSKSGSYIPRGCPLQRSRRLEVLHARVHGPGRDLLLQAPWA